MIRDTLPLWYGEAEPDGSWAGLIPDQHVLTDKGIVPLCPAGNTLFLRKRGNRLACQGQTGDNWLWDGSQWQNLGPSYGVSPVAFAPDGSVVQNTVAFGSQGIRWIDEAGVHTGDATYNSGPPLNLYEYTTHGDVTIGQGGEGGVMAVTPEGRRVLIAAPAYCTFVRFNRTGDALAVAVVIRGGLHLMWFSRQELNTLPLDVPPVPVPVPTPEPAPVSLQAPNEIEVVRRVMREHPEINTRDEATRGRILDFCAMYLNAGGEKWGRKSRNPQGTDLNTDALTYMRPNGLFEIYDVISGGDGSATWDGYGPFRQGENGYWVSAPDANGHPGGQPDTPPQTDQRDIMETLARIAADYAALRAEVQSLAADVKALQEKPAPVVTLPKLRAKGQLRLSLARTQQIDIPVEVVSE